MEMEGRHERGTDEPATSALEHAILTDDDDPLAAASGTMRGPGDGPAVVRLGGEEAWLALPESAAIRGSWDGVGGGDPGDESDHLHATGTLHVETVEDEVAEVTRLLGEGRLEEAQQLLREQTERKIASGGRISEPPTVEQLNEPPERPTVYAAFGLLDDDTLQKLEELGIDVEEVRDPDEPENDVLDARYDDAVTHLAVAEDGVRRELRVLAGGATDLSGLLPRRKCQAWIDLRFQYESDHPHGAPDELEEPRLRRIGALVEQFANLAVENGEAEGMAIVSVVGHVLDKPGDDVPAAS